MKIAYKVGLLGVVVGICFIGAQVFNYKDSVVPDNVFVSTFAGSDDALDNILVAVDGQAFAQLARDPNLDEPEAFADGEAELAYRAKRPVYFYMAWVGSLGRADWVPEAMVVLTVLGVGLLTGTAARLFERRGIKPELALGVAFLPGIMTSFPFLMPGALALGLALLGYLWWESGAAAGDGLSDAARVFDVDGRARPVVGPAILFTLAVLTRETMIFFPAGIALHELVRTRRMPSLWLAIPLVAYGAWSLVVRALTDVPLSSSQSTGRGSAPFVGFLEALPRWSVPGASWILAIATLLLALVAFVRSWRDPLAAVAALSFAGSMLMSWWVWAEWTNWTRAVTPLHMALVVVLLSLVAEKWPYLRA